MPSHHTGVPNEPPGRRVREWGTAMNRRDLLRGLTVAAPLAAFHGSSAAPALAQAPALTGPADLLGYALNLKYVQAEFYRQGNAAGLLSGREADYLAQIGYHKQQHVAALTAAINASGASPPPAPGMDFGQAFASRQSYLETGASIDDTVLGAYVGMPVAPLWDQGEALQDVSGIFSVDARSAAVLNALAGRPIEGGVYSAGGLVPALSYDQVVQRLAPYLTTPWSMAGTAGITS